MLTVIGPTPVLVFATFLLAGLVKGISGMGLPTVAMGLLSALMPPAAAASLLIVPSFVTNLWQLVSGGRLPSLVLRLWPMLLGIAVGTVSSASALARGGGGIEAALGATLVLYALVSLLGRQPSVREGWEPWLSPVVGLATGLVTGATGIFVLPAVPYLQALRLPKDELIQAMGLSFTTSTLALAMGLARAGALEAGASTASLLAVLPALLGMALGARLRSRIDPAGFRRWFLVCLALLGASYLLRAL